MTRNSWTASTWGTAAAWFAYAVMLAAPSSWMSVVDAFAPLIRNVLVRLWLTLLLPASALAGVTPTALLIIWSGLRMFSGMLWTNWFSTTTLRSARAVASGVASA